MYNEIQKALREEGEIDEGLQEWLGNFDLEDVNDMLEHVNPVRISNHEFNYI